MKARDALLVEVVYAAADHQIQRSLRLACGATVADALAAVAMELPFSANELDALAVGIFGRLCERSQVLAQGDRVEIYRELKIDAKAARQRRAQEQKERVQAQQ